MQRLCELQVKSQESDDNPEQEIKSSTKPTEEVPIVLSEQPNQLEVKKQEYSEEKPSCGLPVLAGTETIFEPKQVQVQLNLSGMFWINQFNKLALAKQSFLTDMDPYIVSVLSAPSIFSFLQEGVQRANSQK